MKRIITLILFLSFNYLVMGQNNTRIDLRDLEGKWYINQSNFPMWLKGDKTSPTFNYTLLKKKKGVYLSDKVSYLKNGKIKSINGIDKPLDTTNREFVWRGNGLLSLLKSKWKILHLEVNEQWAIIFFKQTLFTPQGYDVISREPVLSPEVAQKIEATLNELGIQQKLQTINHNQQ